MLKISHLPKKLFNQETKIPPKTTVMRYKKDKICGTDELVFMFSDRMFLKFLWI